MIAVERRHSYVKIETGPALVVLAATLFFLSTLSAGVLAVTLTHERRAGRAERCAATVREFKLRNPGLAHGHVTLGHPCDDVLALTGEIIR